VVDGGEREHGRDGKQADGGDHPPCGRAVLGVLHPQTVKLHVQPLGFLLHLAQPLMALGRALSSSLAHRVDGRDQSGDAGEQRAESSEVRGAPRS